MIPQGSSGGDDLFITSHIKTEIKDSTGQSPISLRIIERRDAASYSRLVCHRFVRLWTENIFFPITEAEAEWRIDEWREYARQPTLYSLRNPRVHSSPGMLCLVVIHQVSQQVIGFCRVTPRNETADIQLAIHPEYQRRGFGTQTIRMLTDWAFMEAVDGGLQMKCVTLAALENNCAFKHMAREKLKIGQGIMTQGRRNPNNMVLNWELKSEQWTIDPYRVIWMM